MKNNIRIVMFFGILFFFFTAFMLNDENQALLDMEKREAASIPSLETHTLEKLPSGWEEYISDHFPYRHKLIKFVSELSVDAFKTVRSDAVVIGKNRWLFLNNIGNTSPRQDYQGTNLFDEEQLKTIEQAAENLYSVSQEKNIDIVVAVAPNKETVYNRYLPESYPAVNQLTRKYQVCDFLKEKSSLKVVNLTNKLVEAAKKQEDIYFIADSHWTGKGAYIGAQEILNALEVKCISFDDMTFSQGNRFECDIANLCGLPDKYTDVYNVVPDGTICENVHEKTVAIVGDSFRYELEQYFAQTFSKYYINDNSISGLHSVLANDIDAMIIIIVERNLGDIERILSDCADILKSK